MEWTDFWHAGANSRKQKANSYFNNFYVGLVKNGRGHLVPETLKSAD